MEGEKPALLEATKDEKPCVGNKRRATRSQCKHLWYNFLVWISILYLLCSLRVNICTCYFLQLWALLLQVKTMNRKIRLKIKGKLTGVMWISSLGMGSPASYIDECRVMCTHSYAVCLYIKSQKIFVGCTFCYVSLMLYSSSLIISSHLLNIMLLHKNRAFYLKLLCTLPNAYCFFVQAEFEEAVF